MFLCTIAISVVIIILAGIRGARSIIVLLGWNFTGAMERGALWSASAISLIKRQALHLNEIYRGKMGEESVNSFFCS